MGKLTYLDESQLALIIFPQIMIIFKIEYQYLIIISKMFDQDPGARVKRVICSLNQQTISIFSLKF